MSEPRVRVVLLNWNDREQTERCLAAVAASEGVTPDVLVVDNGSAADDAGHFRARLGADRVLALPNNRGYAGGMNAGLAFWRERGGDDPLLVLTPDATIRPSTLRLLLDELNATPDAGVVGPVVIYSRELGLLSAGGMVDPSRARAPAVPGPLGDAPYDTHWIDGCCMLIRPAALDDVAPAFDERYFAYFEETDFNGRVRAVGWRVRVVPGAVIDHPKSVGTLPPYYFYYMTRNNYLFWRKNFGVGTARVAVNVAWSTARSVASAVRALVVPRRRPELRARVRDARLQVRGALLGTRDHLRGRYGRMPDATMPRSAG
jgi:N-acetylglucosaminyl-diphospho-decaprenol L-rhamnosyltransferase